MGNVEAPLYMEEYKRNGYRVVARTEKPMPDFLAGFEPDFLAEKEGDNVVVKIVARDELRKMERHLAYWIGEVNNLPEWRFDLIITNSSPWLDKVTGDATEFDIRDVRDRLSEARRLLSEGRLEPACLLAAAVVEASSRLLAASFDTTLANHDPSYVLKQLYAHGVISEANYKRARRFLAVRNTVAHGLTTSELDEGVVTKILSMAERFLSAAEARHRPAGAPAGGASRADSRERSE